MLLIILLFMIGVEIDADFYYWIALTFYTLLYFFA